MRHTVRHAMLLGLAALLTLLSPLSASAPRAGTVPFSCNPSRTKGIASDIGGQTTSTDYVPVPDATITFRQGGSAPGCVLVSFTAQAGWGSSSFRALLDGKPVFTPAESGVPAMEFVATNVAPGPHTLVMQYKLAGDAPSVSVGPHTIQVRYISP